MQLQTQKIDEKYHELVNKYLKEFQEEFPQYRILFMTVYGSRLFGFNTENSDLDIKFIYQPSVQDMVTNMAVRKWNRDSNNGEKSVPTDVQMEGYSVHDFLKLVSDGDSNGLGVLFADSDESKTLYTTDEWKEFQRESAKVVNRNLEAFFGYVLSQANKYSVKTDRLEELLLVKDWVNTLFENGATVSDSLKMHREFIDAKIAETKPSFVFWTEVDGKDYLSVLGRQQIENFKLGNFVKFLNEMEKKYGSRVKDSMEGNIDRKATSHAFRVMSECEDLMLTGRISFPVKGYEFMREIRSGKYEREELFAKLQDRFDELKALQESDKNVLPTITPLQKKEAIRKILSDLYK